MKGWTPRLALRRRLKVIRKWPIQSSTSAHALPRTLKYAEVVTSIVVVPSPLRQPPGISNFLQNKWQILRGVSDVLG